MPLFPGPACNVHPDRPAVLEAILHNPTTPPFGRLAVPDHHRYLCQACDHQLRQFWALLGTQDLDLTELAKARLVALDRYGLADELPDMVEVEVETLEDFAGPGARRGRRRAGAGAPAPRAARGGPVTRGPVLSSITLYIYEDGGQLQLSDDDGVESAETDAEVVSAFLAFVGLALRAGQTLTIAETAALEDR